MAVAAELVEYLYSVVEGLVVIAARKELILAVGKRFVAGKGFGAGAAFGVEEKLAAGQGVVFPAGKKCSVGKRIVAGKVLISVDGLHLMFVAGKELIFVDEIYLKFLDGEGFAVVERFAAGEVFAADAFGMEAGYFQFFSQQDFHSVES